MQLSDFKEHRSFNVYFGHHKCASKWITHVLLKVCSNLGWNTAFLPPWSEEVYENIENKLEKDNIEFIICQESTFDKAKAIVNYKGFHVIRDPRDVVTSAYFSHLNSHSVVGWKDLAKHRKELQKFNKHDGLFSEMEFMNGILYNMYHWNYNQKNVMELRTEELFLNPQQNMIDILRFMNMIDTNNPTLTQNAFSDLTRLINKAHHRFPGLVPVRFKEDGIHDSKLMAIVRKNNFIKMSGGRKKGVEDIKSHYRKGIPGDWKNHFEEDHIRYFKENHNDLLIKLGYEHSNDW